MPEDEEGLLKALVVVPVAAGTGLWLESLSAGDKQRSRRRQQKHLLE